MSLVRTRFAPSPTGFLHIGGARTALFSWAYARRHGGKFILRIEDTDVARSTRSGAGHPGRHGVAGPGPRRGPFYQIRRMDRYKAVIQQMLEAGTAYRCYTTREELDAARRAGSSERRNPLRWPLASRSRKDLPPIPAAYRQWCASGTPGRRGRLGRPGERPHRIRQRRTGRSHHRPRADGTPTYNFCVVVDDWDMGIRHVVRGDDHVNASPPRSTSCGLWRPGVHQYAHLSMILGDDGTKLSKRHGAVSVMQYDDEGYLPEAVINYLARLGGPMALTKSSPATS
ncbi:MAG: glutamate--tRNA ligase family protein [Azonexus sp.]